MMEGKSSAGKYFGIMRPVIGMFSNGDFFRQFFSILLKVIAVLLGLGGLVAWIGVVVASFKLFEYAPLLAVGALVAVVVLLASLIAALQVIFIRADHIRELTGNDFIILPIISVSLRLTGELFAVIMVGTSVATMIITAFGGAQANDFIRQVGISEFAPFAREFGGYSFIGGLLGLVVSVVSACAFLAYFYAMAECVIVLVDIARNTKRTSLLLEKLPGVVARAPLPAAPAVSQTAVPPRSTTCPKCGADYPGEHHGEFCEQCGTKM